MHRVAITAALIVLTGGPVRCQNLLKNAGFEAGADLPDWTTYPMGKAGAEQWAVSKQGPRTGAQCVALTSAKDVGYAQVFVYQAVGSVAPSAKGLLLEGWIRVQDRSNQERAYAYLDLSLISLQRPTGIATETYRSYRVSASKAWQRVSVRVPRAPDVHTVAVRCVVRGTGRAVFDDLVLRADPAAAQLTPVSLVHAESAFSVVLGSKNAKNPWINVSIPFPFEGQTPLALLVKSDPPGAIDALEILKDRENRPLKIRLKDLVAGKKVRVRVHTLVALRDRPVATGKGVKLPKPGEVPPELRQFLLAEPGVEVTDRKVMDLAATFAKDDLLGLLKDLNAALQTKLKYTASDSQGASACLSSGKAVCTGYANLATALLRAAGVPARTLACLMKEAPLQEHFIVQAWTKETGWQRIESTQGFFPWKDSNNVVLRIVYGDAGRTAHLAPMYAELGGGLVGAHLGSVFELTPETGFSFQWTHHQGDFGLTAGDLAILNAARASFEKQVGRKSAGESLRFTIGARPAEKFSESGGDLLEMIRKWCRE